MLTDDEARTLLHRAAGTVEVGPGQPLEPDAPRRRWLVPVVAAAAIVLVVALVVGLTREDGTSPSPAPQPRPTELAEPPTTTPTNDRMPGLLGYHFDEAKEVLEDLGLTVLEHPEPMPCQPPGIVKGTLPSVGEAFRAGEVVKVFVTAPKIVTDCLGEPPWQTIWDLVRFARGLDGGISGLSSTVTLFVVGADPVTITAEQASAPDAWTVCQADVCRSALTTLEQMANWPAGRPHRAGLPFVAVDRSQCGVWPSQWEATGTSTQFSVRVPGIAPAACSSPLILVHLDPATGLLDGVGLQPLTQLGD